MRPASKTRIALIATVLAACLAWAAPGDANQSAAGGGQEPPPGAETGGDPEAPAGDRPAPGGQSPADGSPGSASQQPGEPPDTPRQPSAEDVVRAFQRERPKAVPVLPTGPQDVQNIRRSEQEPAAGPRPRPRLPDGSMLYDRAGRLLSEGPWWVFVFESDSSSYAEPPMKLLPNQTLERMVRESRGGLEPIVFIVSGEVTDFKGENYLLPRKVLRKRDLGNLKK